ncbi:MAG: YcxB family protein [Flavobacteriales bacterium]
MRINTRVTYSEYMKLLFTLAYRKPMMLVVVVLGAAVLLFLVACSLGLEPLPQPHFYHYTALLLILVVQPLAILYTISRTYRSSNHLKERLSIELDAERTRLTGESFSMEFAWTKTYKVVELRNWFMIYQNTLSAVLIPKRAFAPGEQEALRRIVLAVPGLRSQLRRG